MAFLFIVQTTYEDLLKSDKDSKVKQNGEEDPTSEEVKLDNTEGGEKEKTELVVDDLEGSKENKQDDKPADADDKDDITVYDSSVNDKSLPSPSQSPTKSGSDIEIQDSESIPTNTNNEAWDFESTNVAVEPKDNSITLEDKIPAKSNDTKPSGNTDSALNTQNENKTVSESGVENPSNEDVKSEGKVEEEANETQSNIEHASGDNNLQDVTSEEQQHGRFTVLTRKDEKVPDEAEDDRNEDTGKLNADGTGDTISVQSTSSSKLVGGKGKDPEAIIENVKQDDGVIDQKTAFKDLDESDPLTPLVPTVTKLPLHKEVENALVDWNIDNVDMEVIGGGNYCKFSFILEDSRECENVLNKLNGMGVGLLAGTAVSIFPSSIHKSSKTEEEVLTESEKLSSNSSSKDSSTESLFKKSIKSRLVVDQVVETVESNARFTFDYLLLLILASFISCVGLVENSSVVLVASMLISPLMGPILAVAFGHRIQNYDLRNLGLKSEIRGLALCLVVGFTFGLVAGGIGLNGAIWGSTDQWPTSEMASRGMLRSLWVGMLIAVPSGAGVALSVLGGNAGSLVGVAISASLLPPACNAGMLWAYALLAAILPPASHQMLPDTIQTTMQTVISTLATNVTANMSSVVSTNITTMPSITVPTMSTDLPSTLTNITLTAKLHCLPLIDNKYEPIHSCNLAHDAVILGLVSLLLTMLNIVCICFMGVLVLKIKEVAPTTKVVDISGLESFFTEDITVARNYYHTAKGKAAMDIGRQFMAEWKKIKQEKMQTTQTADDDVTMATEEEDSIDDPIQTMQMVNFISDMENSPTAMALCRRLPFFQPNKVAAGLTDVYEEAAHKVNSRLSRLPEVYLSEKKITNREIEKVYKTITHAPTSPDNELMEFRALLRRRHPSAHFDVRTLNEINTSRLHDAGNSLSNSGSQKVDALDHKKSNLFHRRKKVVKFGDSLEEEQSLV